MKQTYRVELTTKQPITAGEDFWMYRGYASKDEALSAAEVLSKFFPYFKYATEILVKEYDLIEKSCRNEKIIKRYKLKNENGQVVKGDIL